MTAARNGALSGAPEGGLIEKTFIRVCRDSRFRLPPAKAAHLTAKLLETDALKVWLVLGTDTMEQIADGTHPCLQLPQYAA